MTTVVFSGLERAGDGLTHFVASENMIDDVSDSVNVRMSLLT
jgi:hypothetical protein